jgi:hypothetical protein
MILGIFDGDGLPQLVAAADEIAKFQFVIKSSAGTDARLSGIGRLCLTARPPERLAANTNGRGKVVLDRQQSVP